MGFEKFGWVTFASQTRLVKFIDYLQDGKICGTKCKECGSLQFPPRAHCTRCLATSIEWKELSGDCTLITFTKVEAAPAAFTEQAPYLLGLAELAEGPKVFAGIDRRLSEESITIGMKLRLKTLKLPNANLSYMLTRPEAS
jgi:uncharacterized OB-fold protein